MKVLFTFVEKKNLWFLISFITITIGFGIMAFKGINHTPFLNFGIDFIGGNTIHLKLNNNQNKDQTVRLTREALTPFELETSQIQLSSNNTIYIKTKSLNNNLTSNIIQSLKEKLGNFEVLEIDYIGPSIGKSLRTQSVLIIIFVSFALLIYITLRFEFSFGLASVIALLHDSLMIFSFASIFNLEINTPFIAAILTILGYSINDTIVIFDRIREELGDNTVLTSITINKALMHTFSRTINTSITTLLVVLSLIIFGGSTIKEFCIILATGVFVGTYSSLCIASPSLLLIHQKLTKE